MSIYARVQDGAVAELFTPPAGFTIDQCFHPGLTWADCTSTPNVAPGWAATEAGSTWTFTAPSAPPSPSLADQAAVMLIGGCQITSAGTPALNGTYACDAQTQIDVQAEVISILLNNTFTNGSASLEFADTQGGFHAFTVVQFKAFATALASYVTTLKSIIANNSGTLPAQPVAIA